MGGFGSGRRGGATIESYRRIDVRVLHKQRQLIAGWRGVWIWSTRGGPCGSVVLENMETAVTLDYSANAEPQRYAVTLEWTACTYGGRRPWFRCPGSNCGRRCAVLYGGQVFACRKCHRLTYESQREARCWRLQRKADRIRARLGVEPRANVIWKPRGTHQRTFDQLRSHVAKADCEALAGLGELVEQLKART